MLAKIYISDRDESKFKRNKSLMCFRLIWRGWGLSPWSLYKSRLSSAESKRNVMFEKVKRWRLIKISQSIFPLIFFCLDCFVIILLLNYMWYPDEQELISVLFGLRQKASNITCSMNITDGVFKLPSALTWL